jgi:TetR/AcrR family transcriptional repressor of nem operon
MESLTVAQLMKDAGLTPGGFYRHFDSRDHLVAEAARRALVQGSAWTIGADQLRGPRGFTNLVDGYLSEWHRDHPESGCGIAGIAADVARSDGTARSAYSQKVKECLGLITELLDEPDHEVAEREAVLTLSSIVGAISLARAVDDPELSKAILVRAATALKELDSN